MQSGSGSSGVGHHLGDHFTPLVDITLVLLIIFIVTAKIIVTPAVPLDLPRAVKTDEVEMVFSVIVPVQGAVLVNGATAKDDDDLLGKVRGRWPRTPRCVP